MNERIEALRPFWWIFVLVGVVEIALSTAAQWHEWTRGKYGPALRHPTAMAVSGSGEIFLYTNYTEIRVFTLDGQLSRAWPVETLQGGASIAFNSEEQLEVFAWRSGRLFLFDTNGRLLHSEVPPPSEASRQPMSGFTRDVGDPSGNWDAPRLQATGPSGDTYEIRGSEIVRSSPTGVSSVVVPGRPSYLWCFFDAPFGPLIFLGHGVIVLLFGVVLLRQRRFDTSEKRPTNRVTTEQAAPAAYANGDRRTEGPDV